MISTLDWCILSLLLAFGCTYGLSYEILELLHQRVVPVRQVASVDPERRRQSKLAAMIYEAKVSKVKQRR